MQTTLQEICALTWPLFLGKELPGTIDSIFIAADGRYFYVTPGIPLHSERGLLKARILCSGSFTCARGQLVRFKLRTPKKVGGTASLEGEILKTLENSVAYGELLDQCVRDLALPLAAIKIARQPVEQYKERLNRFRSLWRERITRREAEFSERARLLDTQKVQLESTALTQADTASRLSATEARLNDAQQEHTRKQSELQKWSEELGTRETKAAEALRRLKDIDLRERAFETEKQSFEQERAKYRNSGVEEAWRLLNHEHTTKAPLVNRLKAGTPIAALWKRIREEMSSAGLLYDDVVLLSATAATCVAARTGQFVVLSGPTGVGKTSLVEHLATVFGAGIGIVPVRPAWIDGTDLLGFFHSQRRRFQPSRFMDHLVNAKEAYDPADRLYFVALDEMNLSRVENYAADFLAKLEKRNGDSQRASIDLYSNDISSDVYATTASSNGNMDPVEKLAIRSHLQRFPGEFELPSGLVLFGTVNFDETTYTPSPKFLDRSFVVQVPAPILESILTLSPSLKNPSTVAGVERSSLRERFPHPDKHYKQVVKQLKEWSAYLEGLNVHLGYRGAIAIREALTFMALWGIKEDQAADVVFLTKILPRISFSRDEKATLRPIDDERKRINGEPKAVLLDEISRRCQGLTNTRAALERMLSGDRPVVRFLE